MHFAGNIMIFYEQLDERTFQCKYCEKPIKSGLPSNTSNLYKHFRRQHTDHAKRICQICGTEVKNSYSLRAHTKLNHSN